MLVLEICACGFVLCPILVVIAYNLVSRSFARRHFTWFAGAAVIWQLASTAAAAIAMGAAGLESYDFGVLWDWTAQGAEYFELNTVKLLLLGIVGMVASVSVLIAARTIDKNRSAYTELLMILLLGMNGMLLVKDLFSLYVFMEVTGICCFVMIAMFRSRADLEGSFKYLVMSELASVFILTGLAFMFMKTGSLRYDELTAIQASFAAGTINDLPDLLQRAALVLLISGFALKTGAVPFHSWLPDAHQSADTAVSVLLSGVVIKIAGVYGLYMVMELFGVYPPVRVSLAAIGVVSVVVGALLAARQKHFKRVVAYSSVSQMGYILLGLSTGTVLGVVGALAHVFSHAAFKSTLFANAAAVHEQAGTLEMDELGGLEERMPITAFTSVIAFLSTAGIPPTAGFWSKLLILLALWQSGGTALAGAALVASILTGVYLLRLERKVFFGKIRSGLESVGEIGGTVRAAEVLLTALTIGVGAAYPLLLMLLRARGII